LVPGGRLTRCQSPRHLGQDLGGEEVEGALEPATDLAQVHLVEAGFLVGPDGLDVRTGIGSARAETMSSVTSWASCSKCRGSGSSCADSPGMLSFGHSRCIVLRA